LSLTREFEIRKSTDEIFDYSVEIVIQDPRQTPYNWTSALVTALNDGTNLDATSEIIDTGRVSTSGNKITFGVKAGVSGSNYVVKVQGTDAFGNKRSAWGTIIVNDPV
jgi:hypothetical protein